MQKKPSIAIYAGAIPSTTFIERLIKGLGDAGYEIQLFGASNTVQIMTITNSGI